MENQQQKDEALNKTKLRSILKKKVRLIFIMLITILNICNSIILYLEDSTSIPTSIVISVIVYLLTIPILIVGTNFFFGKD